MKKLNRSAYTAVVALSAALLSAGAGMAAQPSGGGQASITLNNSDADYCYTHDNLWSLSKQVTGNTIDPATGLGTVTWTVTATKDTSAAPVFCVQGGLTIFNSGSAPATIGNIVVNLQKSNTPKQGSNASHVSIAANVADATNGDAATSANIVAAASAENAATNAAWGTNNYTTSGARGTFAETACSGSLDFRDASNNSIFSMVPQPTIPVGQSITLLYTAKYNVACLPPAGTVMRVEALVSFGNSGARGGSGASATNIDINGNGSLDADEANVRTVPSRVTLDALTAPEETNDSVTLSDMITTTGTALVSNVSSDLPTTTSVGGSWTVSADVNGGPDGGDVCNEVKLNGTADGGQLNVIVGYDLSQPIIDPVTGNIIGYQPIYASFTCAEAASAMATACVTVGPPDMGLENGDYCSYSQGGFGGSGQPFNLLNANFASLYPTGVEVGIPGAGGFSMKFTTAAAVQAYLPAGGGANKLTVDSVNPVSTSSGQFGGQVLALKLNIALSDASATPTGFGGLYYCPATADSLAGFTVSQILAAAETALGGGALPSSYSYSTLAGLAADLDLSFDGKLAPDFPNCGVASAWAVANLSETPCP